jgi:hypothetical protein
LRRLIETPRRGRNASGRQNAASENRKAIFAAVDSQLARLVGEEAAESNPKSSQSRGRFSTGAGVAVGAAEGVSVRWTFVPAGTVWFRKTKASRPLPNRSTRKVESRPTVSLFISRSFRPFRPVRTLLACQEIAMDSDKSTPEACVPY